MLSQLSHDQLQQIWWLIASLVGSLFLFLTFVQGGQTLIFTTATNDKERSLIINSIGRKWELTFTTLVLFGGALFAAFPLFYATSFGGAYWVWIAILFTFIIQAVSFEYRKKPGNLLGTATYDVFLAINGSLGLLLIGCAVGTFFTGSAFTLNDFNQVTWETPFHGLEAAKNPFNLALGLFLVFLARVLGALYLVNNIDYAPLNKRLRKAAWINFLWALPFLLFVLVKLVTMDGFAVDPATGAVFLKPGKYLENLVAMPLVLTLLLAGLLSVIYGVAAARFLGKQSGIWFGGIGTVLVGLSLFAIAGYHDTAFYPSVTDLGSSLTIHNASSSRYTLTAMTYVALAVPLVVAYIAYVWHLMDRKKVTVDEVETNEAGTTY